MDLTTFTAIGLLVTLVITVQNLLRYARAGNGNGVLGILLAIGGGVLVATLAAHAEVTAALHLIDGAPTLGDLDGGSLVLLGVGIGSVAPVATDLLKAIDRNDTQAKPKLLESGQGK